MSDPIHLAKRVADVARCSDAQAGQYIDGGWVRVDGVVVEDPQFPVTTQAVEIDPRARPAPTQPTTEPATILLHKPLHLEFAASASLVTPDTHARVDPSGWRVHARHFDGLTALMALDAHASGLVVLSQGDRVCRRLTADAAELEQEFMVEVAGDTGPDTLGRLARGLRHRGRALPACLVSRQNEALLRFAIKDVRPGQLRHMCAEVGLTALTIKRTRIGRISLGKLPPGQWRYMPVTDRF